MRPLAAVCCALLAAGCATTTAPVERGESGETPAEPKKQPEVSPAPAPFVANELLVRVEDPEAVGAESWPALLGRGDFRAHVVECVGRACRVQLIRTPGIESAPAREEPDWTLGLHEALSRARPPGVLSVELNRIAQPE